MSFLGVVHSCLVQVRLTPFLFRWDPLMSSLGGVHSCLVQVQLTIFSFFPLFQGVQCDLARASFSPFLDIWNLTYDSFFPGKRFSFLAFYIPFLPIYLAYSIDSSCLYLLCIVSFFVLHCFLFVRAFFAWLGWFIDRLDQPRILSAQRRTGQWWHKFCDNFCLMNLYIANLDEYCDEM